MSTPAVTATDAVEKSEPLWSTDQLGEINSFEAALQALADAGVQVSEITEYGDGFSVENNKRTLVNVPFVLMDYKFSEKGDFGEFAILRIVTKDGRKLILTDGSTGICDQVRDLRRRGVVGGVLCPKGVTVSEYDYVNRDTGESTPATTFYLGM